MAIYAHAAAFSDLNLEDILTPVGRSLLDAAWNTQLAVPEWRAVTSPA
jgi:hypothetical protein